MKSQWLQPFPSYHFSARQAAVSLLSGVLVFLIFFIAQPFNINRLPEDLQLLYASMYGTVTALSLLFLTVLLPLVFTKIFNEQQWVVGKEVFFLLFVTVFIAAGNLLAYHFLEGELINITNFLQFLLATVLIGVLPMSVAVLVKQTMLLKKYRADADPINSQLQQETQSFERSTAAINVTANNLPQTILEATRKVVLKGDGSNERLELLEDDLWYLSTADNYVAIVYQDKQLIKTTLFRSTLMKMGSNLTDCKNIIRCHRSYIVNTSKVEKVLASAQGLKLKLIQQKELIPVGKTYINQVKKHLQRLCPPS